MFNLRGTNDMRLKSVEQVLVALLVNSLVYIQNTLGQYTIIYTFLKLIFFTFSSISQKTLSIMNNNKALLTHSNCKTGRIDKLLPNFVSPFRSAET